MQPSLRLCFSIWIAALVERYHIAVARLATAGYGLSMPKATNATLQGRLLNRRVELSKD